MRCAAKIHWYDLRSGGNCWLQLRLSVAAVAAIVGCSCGLPSSGTSAFFLIIGDNQGRNGLLSMVLNGEMLLLLLLMLLLVVVAAAECVAVVVAVAAAHTGEPATTAAV